MNKIMLALLCMLLVDLSTAQHPALLHLQGQLYLAMIAIYKCLYFKV